MDNEKSHDFVAEAAGRLDAVLAGITGISRNQIQRMIRQDMVFVNGNTQTVKYNVKIGDHVLFTVQPPVNVERIAAQDIPLDIIYDDQDVCVVNKPQGMVVHPSPGHADQTLVNGLLYHIKDLSGIGGELRPGIVHRIDKMTSGLLVIAKNDKAHLLLSEQFQARTAHRSYLAIVDGNLKEDTGTIDAPIGRHPVDRKKMAVSKNGKSAITHWTVLERFGNYTFLQLQLVTGRTHQIRVHMAYIKHPVTGDTVYGRTKCAFPLDGQALHGYRLQFVHPVTEEPMVFFAPLPSYFLTTLQKLGWQGNPEKLLCE